MRVPFLLQRNKQTKTKTNVSDFALHQCREIGALRRYKTYGDLHAHFTVRFFSIWRNPLFQSPD